MSVCMYIYSMQTTDCEMIPAVGGRVWHGAEGLLNCYG